MRKVIWLIGHEPFLYNVVQQPKPDIEEWTAPILAVLRAYRGITSIDDCVDRVIELVAPADLAECLPDAPRARRCRAPSMSATCSE